MTTRLLVEETYWYLAYQDGPASDDKYPTEKEAKDALKAMSKHMRMGTCVMSRTIYREPKF